MEGGERKHLQVSWLVFSLFLKKVRPVIVMYVSFLTLVLSIFGRKKGIRSRRVSLSSPDTPSMLFQGEKHHEHPQIDGCQRPCGDTPQRYWDVLSGGLGLDPWARGVSLLPLWWISSLIVGLSSGWRQRWCELWSKKTVVCRNPG